VLGWFFDCLGLRRVLLRFIKEGGFGRGISFPEAKASFFFSKRSGTKTIRGRPQSEKYFKFFANGIY
jgi:hypothetical protein